MHACTKVTPNQAIAGVLLACMAGQGMMKKERKKKTLKSYMAGAF